jgi:hypothetical protein
VDSENFETAVRHVKDGEARIHRQRNLIARLERNGHSTELAMTILLSMENILEQMIAHKESIEVHQKQQELIVLRVAMKTRTKGLPKSLVDEPKHWRERAGAIRSLAINMKAPDSRRLMVKIAEHYEKLAQQAEKVVDRRVRTMTFNV